MTDDALVEIYRAGDIAAASLLTHLLEEQGVPVLSMDSGMDGIPRFLVGTISYRIMVRRSDAQGHAEEIAAAIREFEATMGLEQRT